ncbi:MAG: hypothetical protein IKZ34_03495 [Alphaproteobacteria bacterium]|nr:hypothetical protein [Alphaproteobacteria bacterium]
MQATRASVAPLFYISLIVGATLILFGLYIVIRPRFRKIKVNKPENTPVAAPQPTQQVTNEFELTRPKRLQPNNNLDILSQKTSAVQNIPLTAPVASTQNTPTTQATFTPPTSTTPTQPTSSEQSVLNEIFESAGYVIKKPPRIKGLQTSVLAIGNEETVWLGAIGIKTTDMHTAINELQSLFADTLEDIHITTYGFVIGAPDADTPAPNILIFKDTEDLREFMKKAPNTPMDAEDEENFKAFSNYISTVIDYIGRL